ncbi:ABC-type bacteriocin/lantibiotic exporter, contains an N-terminal double-glycine peptidase domain [Thiohalospira halophila DSM 15071]|uniref:ABC-type bacteriocin/lantibiotic exporter, contains an N-terminal double-glycine peptidase domain n=1 Tax=Thiohalospira halophila DSM 15071 TaxID=1123397 RepID=A0A1I1NF14_9GAMM|nr:ABC transporter ATP-binding protein [Thiohalospira halophila]SFC96127.1 ABC-type bacteriocin/lantibiotic exporter, contains an N-terminal double-glycine peptidase domain [Thiohalospira halophila DSM 15071]
MIKIYRKLRDLLDARERRNAVLLFGMMLVMGLLEAVGIASVMPFISVVSNPGVVETNEYLNAVYTSLGFTSTDAFLLFLGGGVFVLVVGSLAFKALTNWAMARFTHMRNYTLSSRLLRGYLGQPYSFFLNRHSSDLGKSVLSEVGQVIGNALMPAMNLMAHGIVAIFLVALVVAVNPVVAVVAVLVLGGAYSLIYGVLRRYIGRLGIERVKANQERFQIAQEALGGIKDVKVLGLENGYIRGFAGPASRFARVQATNQIINQVPQFALQGLVLGGMIVLLLVLLAAEGGELANVLPVIALYAFAGMRLMPALQQVYGALAKLRFGQPALEALHRDLVETEQAGASATARVRAETDEVLPLKESIELDGIVYAYPEAEQPALNNLSLIIPARTTVGLVGSTGAGKTTAVDLILGLLEPQQGHLKVDGQPVNGEGLRAWQRNIGYVPQSIFLTDDTVAANIAFGVSPEQIDLTAVERAARIAELHDFVVSEMPQGYETLVGERGVRLSGGQRQRIGIARALYHDPEVLVLDEATSALDNLTEKAVMDAVHNLGHRKTIIMIAHRLSTVRECDRIYVLNHGELEAQGTYDELVESHENFRAMATH